VNEFRRPTITPELYDIRSKTWRLLSNVKSNAFYKMGWYYPRTFLSTGDNLVQFRHTTNEVWTLSTSGNGSLKRVGTVPGLPFRKDTPAIMFDENKVLIIQGAQQASVVDIRNPKLPTSMATGSLRELRIWANAVALPNGEVLMVGGASVEESLPHAVRYAEIWNPLSGVWRVAAAAEKSRLYHSTALLLPDATVLVGGGGPPGPEVNLNAEIYEPPYLFAPDGSYAVRPVIATYFGESTYNQTMYVVLTGTSNVIARVSLIRFGSVTHSFNMEERALTLPFEMLSELSLNIMFTGSRSAIPPGWYMLFLVNHLGVPSRALIVNFL
jgi:Domain of unknown function (DUF1929)